MTPEQFDALLSTVAGVPVLRGARCRGRHRLFDPPEEREPADSVAARHRQAVALCEQCPALTPCREWLDGLPLRRRPFGVVAARVRTPRTQDERMAG